MFTIVDLLNSKKGLIFGKGVDDESIKSAEAILSVDFSKEYIAYLKAFGCAVMDKHDLTGITDIDYLNVVSVTTKNRDYNTNISEDFYVIEELNIDGIVIWQDKKGAIYQTVGNSKPQKIFASLSEYLKHE